ncbi:MAG: hypothetical protein V2B13_17205 [Pseudomonadota bacterium]
MSVQLMTPNERKARRLTPEQKLQILKEWEQSGNGYVRGPASPKKSGILPSREYLSQCLRVFRQIAVMKNFYSSVKRKG